jgi:hypothetical protein
VKYVCLVYRDAERLSPADASNLFDDVQQSGHASAGALLDPAIGLTVRAGHLEIESGREGGSAAGYVLIEARDLNDAIRLAERIPKDQFERLEIGAVRQSWPSPPCATESWLTPESPLESEGGAP